LAESEARAITGGKWQLAGLNSRSKIICFKLRLNELTDYEMRISRDIYGAPDLWSSVTESDDHLP